MNQLVTLKLGVEKEYVEVDFPTVTMASTREKGDVIEASKFKGGMKLTVRPHKTEDIEFEIIPDEQVLLERNKNYEYFSIEPKQLNNAK